MILHESVTQSFLPSLPCGRERDDIALSVLCEPRGKSDGSSQSSGVFRGEHGEWRTDFAITAAGTRHETLIKLVATAFLQAGRKVVRENAEAQYREANPRPVASLEEHLKEFEQAWGWKERQWRAELSPADLTKFETLTTEGQRGAFRVVRNWSRFEPENCDFKIHCESLGNRLGMSLKGASKLRRKFCEFGILSQTKPYIANRFCARFRWTTGAEPKRHQSALISPSQWNGDPGDVRLTERQRKK